MIHTHFVVMALFWPVALVVQPVAAQHSQHAASEEYRHLRSADIRGLSQEAVDGYLAGEGMGFALPAELNGYPGPKHVLELRNELELTEAQSDSIEVVFGAMLESARQLGKQLVDGEAMLEKRFRHRHIDYDVLEEQLSHLAQISASLRQTHLAAHLATTELLSARQIEMYEELRGYESDHSHDHPSSAR